MAHSKADVTRARSEFRDAGERLIAIYQGVIAAHQNCLRAEVMISADIESALEVENNKQPKITIKDIANRMTGNGS